MKAARYLNWRINRQVNAEDTDADRRACSDGMGSRSFTVGPLVDKEVACAASPRMRELIPEARRLRATAGRGLEPGGDSMTQLRRSIDHRRRAITAWSAPSTWPRAGLKVRVLERRDVVGGAAVTEEFHPGFRNSVASYTVSLLQPEGDRATWSLHDHGCQVVERPISNFLPLDDGGYLKLGGGLDDPGRVRASSRSRDAERLPAYYDALDAIADVLRDLVLQTPPNCRRRPAHGRSPELLQGARLGRGSQARPDRASATARPVHQVGGRLPRRLVRERRRQGRLRLRRAWSATTPAPTRRARPMCCCTTCSAR